jgi:hypothetical protein
MRKGLHRRIIDDFAPLVPVDWLRIGHTFMRREGAWVQELGVDPSAFDDRYVPAAALEYLHLPTEPPMIVGGVAVQRLQAERHPVDRWYSIREHDHDPSAIFERMREQSALESTNR